MSTLAQHSLNLSPLHGRCGVKKVTESFRELAVATRHIAYGTAQGTQFRFGLLLMLLLATNTLHEFLVARK